MGSGLRSEAAARIRRHHHGAEPRGSIRRAHRPENELLQQGVPWKGTVGEEPRCDEIEILRTYERYTWTVTVGGTRQSSSHREEFGTSAEAFQAARQYTAVKWRDVVFERVDRVRIA